MPHGKTMYVLPHFVLTSPDFWYSL
jgi:hypothetical protein